VAPASAPGRVSGGSETATLEQVTATLSWDGGDNGVTNARLRIDRAGQTVYDQPLPKSLCELCTFSKAIAPDEPGQDLVVRDLDADGEPEVVIQAYSGGAHCCTYAGIYDFRGVPGTYGVLVHGFGNPGYRLHAARDGHVDFDTSDDRFAYAFTAYGGTGEPLLVLRYIRTPRPRMLDVTRHHPTLIEKDAGRWLHEIRHARRGDDIRGLLAAYVADEYLLRRGQHGLTEVRRARRHHRLGPSSRQPWPGGKYYLPALLRFLNHAGYR
jgi:hypothetical protein